MVNTNMRASRIARPTSHTKKRKPRGPGKWSAAVNARRSVSLSGRRKSHEHRAAIAAARVTRNKPHDDPAWQAVYQEKLRIYRLFDLVQRAIHEDNLPTIIPPIRDGRTQFDKLLQDSCTNIEVLHPERLEQALENYDITDQTIERLAAWIGIIDEPI